jgi:hypothetical protein
MAKKFKQENKHTNQAIDNIKQIVVENNISIPNTPTEINTSWYSKITSGFIPYILFAIIGLGIYANTFNHEFALDDDIVICNNEYVLKGVKAIPDILTTDAFSSFFRMQNVSDTTYAARYRPMSYITYAIEQQFIGTMTIPDSIKDIGMDDVRKKAEQQYLKNFVSNGWDLNLNGKQDVGEDYNKDGLFNEKDFKNRGMGMRHVVNVFLFIICVCLLFYLLNTYLFPTQKSISFFASLLFLVHPIHTEVIDNVKSRDEIFSLIFITLTLIYAFKYYYNQSNKNLLLTSLFVFCSFLSKEYAVMLVVLIPLTLYMFTEGDGWKKLKKLYISCVAAIFLYACILFSIAHKMSDNLGTELLNNPYLRVEDTGERIATKIFCLIKYIQLLFIPNPLICDYGYSTFPYRTFASWDFWLSLIVYIGLIFLSYKMLKQRNKYFYGLMIYLLFLFPISNLVFTLPLTIAERLIFHASLGFCILIPSLIVYFVKDKEKHFTISTLLVLPIIVFAYLTIQRNPAWKNDITLAMSDIKKNPNSLLLLANTCGRYIEKGSIPADSLKANENYRKGIEYGLKAVALHDGFANGYLNLGLCYAKLQIYDSAVYCWKKAAETNPNNPLLPIYYQSLGQAYYESGYKKGGTKDWLGGMNDLAKAVIYSPNNPRMWYDYGGFAFNAGQLSVAKTAWEKAYQLNPNDPDIKKVQGVLK